MTSVDGSLAGRLFKNKDCSCLVAWQKKFVQACEPAVCAFCADFGRHTTLATPTTDGRRGPLALLPCANASDVVHLFAADVCLECETGPLPDACRLSRFMHIVWTRDQVRGENGQLDMGALRAKMPPLSPSVVCGNPTCGARELVNDRNFLYCGRCKSIPYCRAECQREHWRAHKEICAPASK